MSPVFRYFAGVLLERVGGFVELYTCNAKFHDQGQAVVRACFDDRCVIFRLAYMDSSGVFWVRWSKSRRPRELDENYKYWFEVDFRSHDAVLGLIDGFVGEALGPFGIESVHGDGADGADGGVLVEVLRGS